jgi:hypothetical protein
MIRAYTGHYRGGKHCYTCTGIRYMDIIGPECPALKRCYLRVIDETVQMVSVHFIICNMIVFNLKTIHGLNVNNCFSSYILETLIEANNICHCQSLCVYSVHPSVSVLIFVTKNWLSSIEIDCIHYMVFTLCIFHW